MAEVDYNAINFKYYKYMVENGSYILSVVLDLPIDSSEYGKVSSDQISVTINNMPTEYGIARAYFSQAGFTYHLPLWVTIDATGDRDTSKAVSYGAYTDSFLTVSGYASIVGSNIFYYLNANFKDSDGNTLYQYKNDSVYANGNVRGLCFTPIFIRTTDDVYMFASSGAAYTHNVNNVYTHTTFGKKGSGDSAILLSTQFLSGLYKNASSRIKEFLNESTEYDPDDYTNPDSKPTKPTGNGNYTDSGTDTIPDRSSRVTSGLFGVYKITSSQLASLGEFLWSSSFIDSLAKAFNDPIDTIISLHYLPITANTVGTRNIYLGNQDSGVSSDIATDFTTLNFGSVSLGRPRGMFLDQSPYTKVQIHVPFCGIYELNTDEIMGNTLTLLESVDNITGNVIAALEVTQSGVTKTLYTWSGQCGEELPVTGRNYASIYMGVASGITNTAIGIGSAVASAGATAPLTAMAISSGISSSVNGVMSSKPTVNHGASGSAGFMDVKQAYLIVEYPRLAGLGKGGDKDYSGIPSCTRSALSSMSGFTQVDFVNLQIAGATESEIDEAKTLLSRGVIL